MTFEELQVNLSDLIDEIATQMHRGNYNGYLLSDVFAENQKYLHDLIDKRYPSSKNTALNKQLKSNVDRFLAGKNFEQYNEMKNALTQNIGIKLDLFKEKSKSINNLYNNTWLKTESDFMKNAIEVSKRLDSYENLLKTNKYVLQYVATNDELTRPSHSALHGVCYPANDPFWYTHMPPWDYNCRCSVKLVRISSLSPDWNIKSGEQVAKSGVNQEKRPQGLNQNIRSNGKFFTDNHPYINGNNVDVILGNINKELGR